MQGSFQNESNSRFPWLFVEGCSQSKYSEVLSQVDLALKMEQGNSVLLAISEDMLLTCQWLTYLHTRRWSGEGEVVVMEMAVSGDEVGCVSTNMGVLSDVNSFALGLCR